MPIPTSCFACCSIWCATPRRRWKAARAATRRRAQIRITGRREGAVAIIEVSDTGPGVPDKAREHLFEAFQGSAAPGGSGLGLAIAAELVRAHGGDIHLVEGTIGATFRITIPDRPVELQSRPQRAGPGVRPGHSRPSFRGDAQHRTRNPELMTGYFAAFPLCAVREATPINSLGFAAQNPPSDLAKPSRSG